MNEIQKLQQVVKKIEPSIFMCTFFYRKEFIIEGKEKSHGKYKCFNEKILRHNTLFCLWLWPE